jgi:hypothetical protein
MLDREEMSLMSITLEASVGLKSMSTFVFFLIVPHRMAFVRNG